MSTQPRFLVSVAKTVVVGLLVGTGLVGVAWSLGFPPVFLKMFGAYAALGTVVFILLEAPPMKPVTGVKALAGLIGFYTVLSIAYIIGASAWPQYDPEEEKGKIAKLLKPKRDKAAQEQAMIDESMKRLVALEAKAETLLSRLNRLAPETAPVMPMPATPSTATSDLLVRGMEVYELHECYNCHKIGGKGGVKKRGPELDNIGNLLTIGDIKKKIIDPTYLYAEGFEKEHKKGVMPDKYKDLMTEEELTALAAYLSTLKNPAVQTPRPIYVKTKVEHGFTVYGYVRDPGGKPLAGVEVQAKPLKAHAHASSTKTNAEGYYEIFLHLHNEDAGTRIAVSAKGVHKEIVATYDPNDKVTKRQAAVDLTIS